MLEIERGSTDAKVGRAVESERRVFVVDVAPLETVDARPRCTFQVFFAIGRAGAAVGA